MSMKMDFWPRFLNFKNLISVEAQIAIEVIDEIMNEVCINGASIQDNVIEKSSGDDIEIVDQCDAGTMANKDIVQENQVSSKNVELEAFEHFEALNGNNNRQTGDVNDEVRLVDGAICNGNIANDGNFDRQGIAELTNDMQTSLNCNAGTSGYKDSVQEVSNLNAQADVFKHSTLDGNKSQAGEIITDVAPAKELKKSAAANGDFLKSFSTHHFKGLSVTDNVTLMASGVNVSKYEVRCENMPPAITVQELILKFTRFGQVYKLTKHIETRVVYVTFTKPEDAERAIQALNNQVVLGSRIHLFKQLPNRRLIVRNTPKTMGKNELFKIFKPVTPDLASVSVYNDPVNEMHNRGFCYLEYPEHYQAAEAKKILSSRQLFRNFTVVEWPDRCFEWKETPDTLFISNIRSSLQTRDLNHILSVFGQITSVNRNGTFASVRFQKTEDAKRAAKEVDKSLLGNENVEILTVRLTHSQDLYRSTSSPPSVPMSNDVKRADENAAAKAVQPNIDHKISDTLFINNLAATVPVADLRDIFSHYGNVLYVELNRNIGWASVNFSTPEQAKRAASSVDKQQLGNNVHISFFNDTADQNSDMLCLTNLRSDISTSDLRKLFTVYGGIMEIELDKNSAMIHFRNVEDAKTAARSVDKQCMGDSVQISFGKRKDNDADVKRAETSEKTSEIKHAEKKTEKKRPEASQNKVERKPAFTSNILYIYKMFDNMTTRRLRELFSVYGHVMDIEIDKHKRYGSVLFEKEEDAIKAHHAVHRIHLGPGPGFCDILFFPKTQT